MAYTNIWQTLIKFEAWFEGRLVGDKLVLVSVIINSFSLTIVERSAKSNYKKLPPNVLHTHNYSA